MVAHPGTRSSSLNFGPPCMKNGVMGNSPVDQAVIGQVTDHFREIRSQLPRSLSASRFLAQVELLLPDVLRRMRVTQEFTRASTTASTGKHSRRTWLTSGTCK